MKKQDITSINDKVKFMINTTDNILFVSDVHLRCQEPDRINSFIEFLNTNASNVNTFFILGDLFDFWMGDSDFKTKEYQPLFETFKKLTSNGKRIYYITGNRDFYIDSSFKKLTGVIYCGTECSLHFNNRKIYLTHGDNLCINDAVFQLFRRIVRSQISRDVYNSLPHYIKMLMFRIVKRFSKRPATRDKTPSRNIIPLEALKRKLNDGYDMIICGHSHMQYASIFKQGDDRKEIRMLGEWNGTQSYLIIDNENLQDKHIPRNE